MKIIESKVDNLINKEVALIKIRWRNHESKKVLGRNKKK